jgi:hypothetical protein
MLVEQITTSLSLVTAGSICSLRAQPAAASKRGHLKESAGSIQFVNLIKGQKKNEPVTPCVNVALASVLLDPNVTVIA